MYNSIFSLSWKKKIIFWKKKWSIPGNVNENNVFNNNILSMNKNQNKIVSLRMFSYNIDFQYIA